MQNLHRKNLRKVLLFYEYKLYLISVNYSFLYILLNLFFSINVFKFQVAKFTIEPLF